ncbi:NAD(P)/FAD-dependent oxidoreductase [Mycolicibacterium stellerae]|uniref:NAD(P)/FAD-dependent oxidoreductase n=1 Tax=Mycolicibacterium stellerae TaxID=2358193 RepID=UPI000F0B0EB5|nr:FAD-dependent oxidoreductase [Mycolicibacterium stellerae]
MTGKRTHVVVIGGGYAGTLAANHLRLRSDIDITLVNPRPKFVERIRLHQLVAGTGEATADYGTLLGEGIQLVVDSASRINTAAQTVEFASGRKPVHYDYVIYAVGSTGAVPASVPGAAEFAYPIAELELAQRLRTAIDELHPDAPVTVIGAGLTGIETASELAEQGRKVTLVCGGQLAPSLSEPGRRSVAKWMRKHRVAVLESDVVAEVRRNAVVFADGAVRPSAVTIWTAGFGVPELATASGLRTDTLGRLLTDETLTSVDDDRIVAAGDCAAPSDQPLRMSCQAAGPLATQAADTVLSRIAGEEPGVIKPRFVGTCTSLGRYGATLQVSRADDTPLRLYFSGRLAAKVKEAVCKGTLWGLRQEAKKPGSSPVFKGDKRCVQSAAAPQVVTNP